MTQPLFPDEIIALAQRVIDENAKAGRTITVAESCTGGLVSAALTEIPGASKVFERGFVSYTNKAKVEMLGVPSDIIETFGAVSIACVWAMAKGAIERSDADIAVAISGIAGPEGGSELKPVGTVVIAKALKGEKEAQPEAELMEFDDTGRSGVRRQAMICALELLLP